MKGVVWVLGGIICVALVTAAVMVAYAYVIISVFP